MKLTIEEYQPLTQRTCPDLGSLYYGLLEFKPEDSKILADKLNLSHMVLGMGSELSELDDAYDKEDQVNIAEEGADIMWYVGNYCNLRQINLKAVLNLVKEDEEDKGLDWFIHELTDLVKKFMAYGKHIDTGKEVLYIRGIVFNVITLFETYEDFEKALFNNIEKLRVRYPEKFTEENALNRNLEAERKELEK